MPDQPLHGLLLLLRLLIKLQSGLQGRLLLPARLLREPVSLISIGCYSNQGWQCLLNRRVLQEDLRNMDCFRKP